MTRTVTICLVTCMMVLAVACSDDGGGGGGIGIGGGGVSDEAKPYVESLSKNLSMEGNESLLEVEEEQADCIAPKWVDILQPERLKKAGVKAADLGADDSDLLVELKLSSDEGSALVDAFADCGST